MIAGGDELIAKTGQKFGGTTWDSELSHIQRALSKLGDASLILERFLDFFAKQYHID